MAAKSLFCTRECTTSSYWLGRFFTCSHPSRLNFRGQAARTAGTRVPMRFKNFGKDAAIRWVQDVEQ